MNERELALRNLTYRLFVELGRAPSAAETAAVAGESVAAVLSGWRALHAWPGENALVLYGREDSIASMR